MTCDLALKAIPLYFYGELTPSEEERVEQHMHECETCSRELERQRALGPALDRRRIEPSAGSLLRASPRSRLSSRPRRG